MPRDPAGRTRRRQTRRWHRRRARSSACSAQLPRGSRSCHALRPRTRGPTMDFVSPRHHPRGLRFIARWHEARRRTRRPHARWRERRSPLQQRPSRRRATCQSRRMSPTARMMPTASSSRSARRSSTRPVRSLARRCCVGSCHHVLAADTTSRASPPRAADRRVIVLRVRGCTTTPRASRCDGRFDVTGRRTCDLEAISVAATLAATLTAKLAVDAPISCHRGRRSRCR